MQLKLNRVDATMRIWKQWLLTPLLLLPVYILAQVPTITEFSPASAVTGAALTITGGNFNITPENNIVYFGAVKATVMGGTLSQLFVKVPSGAAYGPITVLNTVTKLTGRSQGSFVPTFTGGTAIAAFTARSEIHAGGDPQKALLSDVTMNGKPELVVATKLFNAVSVFPNNSTTGSIAFGFGKLFSTGLSPVDIAVSDINNDGKPDILSCNSGSNTISVLLNTTLGDSAVFAPKQDFATKTNPRYIISSDLDKDGWNDIVVTHADTISVFRNTSSGGSVSFVRTDIVEAAGPVCAADIDGDGKPDLFVVNTAANAAYGFYNTSTVGTISFASRQNLGSFSSPAAVTAGDIDGDGKTDIIVSKTGSGPVQVLVNNSTLGGMSFSGNQATGSVTAIIAGITTGDFNGDGKPDLAAQYQNEFQFIANNSTPATFSFGATASKETHTSPSYITNGDLDGDGRTDMVVTSPHSNSVHLFRNITTDIVPAITSFEPTGGGTGSQITITGTGFLDVTDVRFGGTAAMGFRVISPTTFVATVGFGASGSISVTTGGGTAGKNGFVYHPSPGISAFTPQSAAAGGTLTITGSNLSTANAVTIGGTAAASFKVLSSTTITVVVGAGSSGAIKVTTEGGSSSLNGFVFIYTPIITSVSPLNAAAGSLITINGSDFDTVHSNLVVQFAGVRAEITSGNSTQLTVKVPRGATYGYITVTDKNRKLTGYSAKKFLPVFLPKNNIVPADFSEKTDITLPGAGYAGNLLPVDVDGDSLPDIVTVQYVSGDKLLVLRNLSPKDTIRFDAPKSFVSGNTTRGLACGDLDGDGKPDFVTSNVGESGIKGYSVFRNTSTPGDIQFAARTSLPVPGTLTAGESVDISDFDMDGKPDILVTNVNGLLLFRNTTQPGDTLSFAAPFSYAAVNPQQVSAADLNGDGIPDILVVNPGSPQVSIITNKSSQGSFSFTGTTGVETYSQPLSVASADIDNDGKADILSGSYSGGKISVLKNNTVSAGPISLGSHLDFEVGPTPNHILVADLNGDGKADVLTPLLSSKYVSVLKNNNTGISNTAFSEAVSLTCNLSPIATAVADFDFDGKPDIAVTGVGLTILKNKMTPEKPVISSVSPLSAVKGTVLTITGSNLDNVVSVTLGGTNAASFQRLSSTTLLAVVGTGSSGTISVTTVAGSAGFNGFEFISQIPVISSVTPMSAVKGAVLTITGSNLDSIVSVTLGGTNAASFQRLSSTTLLAVVGAGSSGTISVTTAKGSAGFNGFEFISQIPVISSVTPMSAVKGAVLTITGSNLDSVISVTLGGTNAASFQRLSSTTLLAVVGAGSSGTISVTTTKGSAGLNGFEFISPPPVISLIAPMSALSGTSLTITGDHFISVTSVELGGVAAASFKVLSPTTIIAIVGAGSSGIISVTTQYGPAGKSGFIYVPPVEIIHDSTDICVGDTAVLYSSVPFGNQWYRNGVLIPGATTDSYTATRTGNYKVVITAAGIQYPSKKEVSIRVHSIPKTDFAVNDTLQCIQGNVFRFENKSTMDGDSADTMLSSWLFEGNTGSDRRHPVYSFAKAGSYNVKLSMTNRLGCSSDTVVQTVQVLPMPVNRSESPPAICGNKGLTANITVPIALVNTGVTYSYWTDSTTTTAVTNAAAISVAGTYYVKADSAGCTITKPVTVTINNSPVAGTLTGDNILCPDNTYTFSSTTAGGSWNSSDTLVAAFRNPGVLRAKIPGTTQLLYVVTLSPSGCSDTSRKTITVNPLPITGKPVISGYTIDTLVCFINDLSVSANSYNKYLWSTGATTRSVTVSDNTMLSLRVGNNGSPCYSEPSIIINARKNVTPVPQIARSLDILNSTASNHYQWAFNNKDIAGAKNASLAIDKRGAYTVRTSVDSACWQTSAEYIVLLEALPAPAARKTFDLKSYPNPTNGNFNIQVKFERNTSALINLNLSNASGVVVWSAKKVLFLGTTIRVPVNMALPAGTYTVKVDVNGEINSQQVIIQ